MAAGWRRPEQAQALREAGQEPYAYTFERTHMAAQLQEQFRGLGNGETADLQVALSLQSILSMEVLSRTELSIMQGRLRYDSTAKDAVCGLMGRNPQR